MRKPINQWLWIGIALLLSGLTTGSTFAQGASSGKVMLVLDASGSMWGRVEEREKILIAREVVGQMLDHWDPALSLGLVAYGHRQKGECTDIETLVPVGGALDRIRSTVNALQPRGKTPLSAAVKQAAEHLRFTEEKATVILVSDGKETCDLDPCEVGRSLEQLGVDFTAHVIGFDISVEDRVGLECLASETGGQYFDAQKSDELRVALEQAVEQIKSQPDTVIARLGAGGPELKNTSIQWRYTGDGTAEGSHTGAVLSLPLEEGGYQVSATLKGISGKVQADVVIGETRKHEVVIAAGRASFSATAVVGGESVNQPDVAWSVVDDNENEVAALRGHTGELYLTPGRYNVVGVFEGQTQGTEFVIESGDQPDVTLAFTIDPASLTAPDSAVVSSAIEVTWEGPGADTDYVTVVPPDAEKGKYLDYAYLREGNPVSIIMPDSAGVYELRYVTANARRVIARRPIQVEGVNHALAAPDTAPISTTIEVAWEGANGERDYITIVEPDAEDGKYGKYFYTRKQNPGKLLLPDTPGEYELRYVSDQSRTVKARRTITVSEVSTVLTAADTAAMGSELDITWEGPDGARDYITVVPPDAEDKKYGKYVYTKHGNPIKLVMPDQPGTYELRYVSGQSGKVQARRPVEITEVSVVIDAPESAPMGRELKFAWEGPDGKGDYITVVPPETEDRKYGKYTYTRHGSPMKLVMPDSPGEYELRYVSNQSNSVLARRLIVIEAVAVSLEVPAQVPVSKKLDIPWAGPDGPGDYITVVTPDTPDRKYGKYTYTKGGNPANLVMPDQAGVYEIRYVSNQSNTVLARQSIEVTAVAVDLGAPVEATIGQAVEVAWQGPDGQNDFITVVPVGAEDRETAKIIYTRSGNPAKLNMPDSEGLYEIRYVSGQSRTVLGRAPVEVKAVAVTLESLSIAAADKSLRVLWQGPGAARDKVAVAAVTDADDKWVRYVTVKQSPVDLRMPKEPGVYELRYVTGQSRRVLSRRLVEVVPEAEYLDRMAAMAPGTLKLSATLDGQPITEGVGWQVYAVDGRPANIQRSDAPNAEFALSMGLYRANLTSPGGSRSVEIMLDSGKTLEAVVALP